MIYCIENNVFEAYKHVNGKLLASLVCYNGIVVIEEGDFSCFLSRKDHWKAFGIKGNFVKAPKLTKEELEQLAKSPDAKFHPTYTGI